MRERAQARNFFLQLYFRLDSALARHRLHPVKDFRFGCVCENGEIAQLFDTQFPPCKNRSSGFFLQGGLGRRATQSLAEVAELADAHGSGPCTRKGVGVRVPSSAPLLLLSSSCRLVIPTLIPHQGKGHRESSMQRHQKGAYSARLALLPRRAVRE